MEFEETPLIDKFGWKYYDEPPDNFTLAIIDDFHINGRKIIGQMFLIRWADKEYYQICHVSERLSGKFLLPFIQANRVFIKKNQTNGCTNNQSAN